MAESKTVKAKRAAENINDVKGVTFLSYLGILLVIPIVLHPNSKFVKFHANQGLVLMLATIILQLFLTFSIIFIWLLPVVWIIVIIYVVLGMVSVSNGAMKRLPLIGKIDIIK